MNQAYRVDQFTNKHGYVPSWEHMAMVTNSRLLCLQCTLICSALAPVEDGILTLHVCRMTNPPECKAEIDKATTCLYDVEMLMVMHT